MKPYLVTTGAIFGLITVVHFWRMTVEGHLAQDPWYLLLTLLAGGLCFWAGWLLCRSPKH